MEQHSCSPHDFFSDNVYLDWGSLTPGAKQNRVWLALSIVLLGPSWAVCLRRENRVGLWQHCMTWQQHTCVVESLFSMGL